MATISYKNKFWSENAREGRVLEDLQKTDVIDENYKRDEFKGKCESAGLQYEEEFSTTVLSTLYPAWSECNNFTHVYIRQSYKDLEKLIYEKHESRNIILSGTPGVGKSVFAIYILYKSLQKNMKVVVQSSRTSQHYLYEKDQRSVKVCNSSNFNPNCLYEENTLLLIDASSKFLQALTGTCRVMLFTSPGIDKYKDFIKNPKFISLYMPVWSLDELIFASLLPEYTSINMDEIFRLYSKYGGIARLIFSPIDKLALLDGIIEVAANSSVVRNILLKPGEVDFSQSSHVLFSEVVYDEFKRCYLVYASTWIQNMVYKGMRDNQRVELLQFLRLPITDDYLSGFCGNIFEEEAHRRLINGGKFKVRQLSSDSTVNEAQEITLPKLNLVEFITLKEISYCNIGGKFMVPISRVFESIDSVCLCSPAIAFQCTISPKHSIKCKGMQTLIKALKSVKDIKVYNPTSPNLRFYFVVPDYHFDSFTKQQMYTTTAGKMCENVPDDIAKVRQYALCIKLT